MDKKFWQQKWDNNDIGFHKSEANPVLVQYFGELSLKLGSHVFVPLCGKTLDIAWLLAQGYRVTGAELVEIAIEQLFEELGVEPSISSLGNSSVGELKRYSADNIDIFVGSLFDISTGMLGSVNAIYDRAALVALPETIRRQYTAHLLEITSKAPQLLVTFEYDQTVMNGPPFSIDSAELEQHYGAHYELSRIASTEVGGGFKGKCAAQENVWLLR